MTAFLVLFVGVPLLFIVVATRRFGFRAIPTLLASVAGATVGLCLFFAYNRWKAAAVLAGKTSGAVVYFPEPSLSSRLTALIVVCALGAFVGLLALLAHYVYSRTKSA